VSLSLKTGRPLAVGLLAAAIAQGAWAIDDVQPAPERPVLAVAAEEQFVAAEQATAVLPEPDAPSRPAWLVAVELAAQEAAQVAAQEGANAPAAAALAVPVVNEAAAADPSSGGDAATDDAGGGASPDVAPPSKRDPFEAFNRKVYGFNDAIDNAALRPLAEGYRRAVPELARTGVENFFGNISDIWSAINKLLQGKVMQSAQMSLRVATNTVFGLCGLLDPATEFGLERQPEDFGQTLGTWGVPAGPYLVLPILGPSTLRDTAALPLDRVVASPSRYLGGSTNAQVGVTGVQLVSARAGLLSTSRLLGEVALDKYSFLRDAYLARRRSQLYDGNPPDDEETADPR